MAMIQKILDELQASGLRAEWGNTGGNCMAVLVPLADGGELLITDLEGPFTHNDRDADDEIDGFSVYRYDAEGEPAGIVFETGLLRDGDSTEWTGMERRSPLLAIDVLIAKTRIAAGVPMSLPAPSMRNA